MIGVQNKRQRRFLAEQLREHGNEPQNSQAFRHHNHRIVVQGLLKSFFVVRAALSWVKFHGAAPLMRFVSRGYDWGRARAKLLYTPPI